MGICEVLCYSLKSVYRVPTSLLILRTQSVQVWLYVECRPRPNSLSIQR